MRGRLRRLEAASRRARCPECELPPDDPGYIVYREGEERPKGADERCTRCGRRLRFLIKVVYGPEKAHEGGRG